jgi:hypothetical protein
MPATGPRSLGMSLGRYFRGVLAASRPADVSFWFSAPSGLALLCVCPYGCYVYFNTNFMVPSFPLSLGLCTLSFGSWHVCVSLRLSASMDCDFVCLPIKLDFVCLNALS